MGADQPGYDLDTHSGIGFLTATASDDWTLLLELCERASASEGAAKEAAKALKQEFKYVDLELTLTSNGGLLTGIDMRTRLHS